MPAKRIAVIGSNCFSGSHLVDALLENPEYEVFAVSRSAESKGLYLPYKRQARQPKFFRANLVKETDKVLQILDEIKPAYVINFAGLSEVALSNTSPDEYFLTNTCGTVSLVNKLRERDYLKRYIHISSAEIYGPCNGPITESAALNPSTPYAVSKAAADMYLLTLLKNFYFPVVLVRSTNVYGKHQQLFKIIPRAAIYIKMKKKIQLHGGGASVKSFIHIRDVIRGILQIIENGNPSAIYHFSTQNNRTIREVVELICRRMGQKFEDSVAVAGERLGQDNRYLLDSTRARKELGWEPVEDFEKGIDEVVDWIDSSWAEIQKEPLEYIHKI